MIENHESDKLTQMSLRLWLWFREILNSFNFVRKKGDSLLINGEDQENLVV